MKRQRRSNAETQSEASREPSAHETETWLDESAAAETWAYESAAAKAWAYESTAAETWAYEAAVAETRAYESAATDAWADEPATPKAWAYEATVSEAAPHASADHTGAAEASPSEPTAAGPGSKPAAVLTVRSRCQEQNCDPEPHDRLLYRA